MSDSEPGGNSLVGPQEGGPAEVHIREAMKIAKLGWPKDQTDHVEWKKASIKKRAS